MSRSRKNLIILSSDEMRGDCPSYMGNPDCRTPHLDRFARRDIALRQHFSVFPKCVPSRIAMMTGCYCYADGGHEEEMQERMEYRPDSSGKQRTYARYPETMARTKMCRSENHKLVTRLTCSNA